MKVQVRIRLGYLKEQLAQLREAVKHYDEEQGDGHHFVFGCIRELLSNAADHLERIPDKPFTKGGE